MADHPIPSVSVIVPTRNRPVLLAATLRAIANQSHPTFDVHVSDDGSAAEVLATYPALFAELGERFRLHPPSAPDAMGTGPSASRNRGVRASGGDFLAFCDDDDLWSAPDHLAVAVDALLRHDADLYFANMRGESRGVVTIPDWFPDCPELTAGPRLAASVPVHEVSQRDFAAVMRRHYAHLNTVVVRRALFQALGGFWETTRVHEDVDLLLRAADRAGRILYRPESVVRFNVSPRDSIIAREPAPEQHLLGLAVGQHVRLTVRHRALRRTARAFEAWHLRQLAECQRSRGAPGAAGLAWQALCLYPTAGALVEFLRHTAAGLRPLRPAAEVKTSPCSQA